jgi:hypothetical protein
MNERSCEEVLEENEKRAWETFKFVVDNFLGRHKLHNYRTEG